MSKEDPVEKFNRVELEMLNDVLDGYQRAMMTQSHAEFTIRQNVLLLDLAKYVIFIMMQGRDEKPKQIKRKKRK